MNKNIKKTHGQNFLVLNKNMDKPHRFWIHFPYERAISISLWNSESKLMRLRKRSGLGRLVTSWWRDGCFKGDQKAPAFGLLV